MAINHYGFYSHRPKGLTPASLNELIVGVVADVTKIADSLEKVSTLPSVRDKQALQATYDLVIKELNAIRALQQADSLVQHNDSTQHQVSVTSLGKR